MAAPGTNRLHLRSATVDNFQAINQPTDVAAAGGSHPAETRRGGIPLSFQVTSPFDRRKALLPHALVMHVNPTSLNETHAKKKEVLQTRGGWVEQHWGEELDEISAEGSTGAFMNIYTGLSSVLRQQTIAWDRFRDLYDLYRNNGSVYDPFGNIVLQGNIALMYDRGLYLGYFKTFSFEENETSPFAFSLSWTFKVQQTVTKVPTSSVTSRAPSFQSTNQTKATLGLQGVSLTAHSKEDEAAAAAAEARAAAARAAAEAATAADTSAHVIF